MNNYHWMVSLGRANVPKKWSEPRIPIEDKRTYQSKRVCTTDYERNALKEEIIELIKSGLNDRDEVYFTLKDTDKLPRSCDRVLSITRFYKLFQDIKREVGLNPIPKKTLICEMFDTGIGLDKIVTELSTTPEYVRAILLKAGRVE